MSLTDGMGEHWGSFLVSNSILKIIKRIIKQIVKKVGTLIKELFPKYIEMRFKIPVEQLSFVQPHVKVIDVSQLVFEEEPLLSWEDLIKFGKRGK